MPTHTFKFQGLIIFFFSHHLFGIIIAFIIESNFYLKIY